MNKIVFNRKTRNYNKKIKNLHKLKKFNKKK